MQQANGSGRFEVVKSATGPADDSAQAAPAQQQGQRSFWRSGEHSGTLFQESAMDEDRFEFAIDDDDEEDDVDDEDEDDDIDDRHVDDDDDHHVEFTNRSTSAHKSHIASLGACGPQQMLTMSSTRAASDATPPSRLRRKMPIRLFTGSGSPIATSSSTHTASAAAGGVPAVDAGVSRSASSASVSATGVNDRSGSSTPKRQSVFSDSGADEFKRFRHASCPDLAWAMEDLAFLRASSPPLSPGLPKASSMRAGSYASFSPSPCASPRTAASLGSSSSASSVLSLGLAPLHISSPPPIAAPTLMLQDAPSASSARSLPTNDSGRSSASHSRGSNTSSPSTSCHSPDASFAAMLRSPTKTPPSASPRERLAAEFQRHQAERRARAAVRQASFGDSGTVLSGSIPLFSFSGGLLTRSAGDVAAPSGASTVGSPSSTLLGNASPMLAALSSSPFGVSASPSVRSRTRTRRTRQPDFSAGAADDTSTRSALSSPTDSLCDTASVRDDDDASSDAPLSPTTPMTARSLFSGTNLNLPLTSPVPASSLSSRGTVSVSLTSFGRLDGSMLPALSVEATAHLLLGNRAFLCGTDEADVAVIDCRFPYEFNGGHIAGAVNLYTKRDVEHYFFGGMGQRPAVPPNPQRKQIFLFHCEFSSHRGPALLRHVRSIDRRINSQRYPHMSFPDLYLIAGGYVAFGERFAPESVALGRRRVNVDGVATPPRLRTFASANEPRSYSQQTVVSPDTTPRSLTPSSAAMPESFVLADTVTLHGPLRVPASLERLFDPHEPPLYTAMDDKRFKNERREFMRKIRRSPARRSQSMAELSTKR
jgi:hypothetical protein